ncbi:MAG: hypothetical protein QGG09_13635, partial [Pirellulaceae bacterium]|nr:hypothetical protein [Pirellulaceae bacterium]
PNRRPPPILRPPPIQRLHQHPVGRVAGRHGLDRPFRAPSLWPAHSKGYCSGPTHPLHQGR